jgi:hypothetical protein
MKFIGTGESMLSRSDVVKRMWDYIKENNLQVNSFSWILCCCFFYHVNLAFSIHIDRVVQSFKHETLFCEP